MLHVFARCGVDLVSRVDSWSFLLLVSNSCRALWYIPCELEYENKLKQSWNRVLHQMCKFFKNWILQKKIVVIFVVIMVFDFRMLLLNCSHILYIEWLFAVVHALPVHTRTHIYHFDIYYHAVHYNLLNSMMQDIFVLLYRHLISAKSRFSFKYFQPTKVKLN